MRVFVRWLPMLVLFDVLCVAVLFCVSGIIPMSYATEAPRMSAERPASPNNGAEDYYRGQLEGDELVLYDTLERAYRSLVHVIDVPDGTDSDEFVKVMGYVLADNPDIFWVDGSYNYQQEIWGFANASVIYLHDDPDQIAEMSERYEAAARDLLKQAHDQADLDMVFDVDDDTGEPWHSYDYFVARRLFQLLAYNVEYSASDDSSDQTISTVFDDHETVCAGYSRAMKYLCDMEGIPCLYVSGGAYDNGEASSDASHAWNVLELEGRTVYVDATWGDDGNIVEWRWFDMPLESFYKSHTARYGEMFDRPAWPDGVRQGEIDRGEDEAGDATSVNISFIVDAAYDTIDELKFRRDGFAGRLDVIRENIATSAVDQEGGDI